MAILLLPLGGCLIPLASDLGAASSYLHHHHLLKPVLPDMPSGDEPLGEPEAPLPSTATETRE